MERVVSPNETSTRSVQRAAELLRLIGKSDTGCRLSELARAADLSKATVHRLLQTLMGEGLVDLDPCTGRYAIGAELIRIAAAAQASSQRSLVRELEVRSAAAMRSLSDRSGETSALVIRQGEDRTNVAIALGTHELIAVPRIGSRLPLHLGGPGKLLVAFLSPAEQEALARGSKLAHPAGRTFSLDRTTSAELRTIRDEGYATSLAEAVEGQASIACPVLRDGVVIAALNLIIPMVRFNEDRRAAFLPLVREAAAQISGMLEGSAVSGPLVGRKT